MPGLSVWLLQGYKHRSHGGEKEGKGEEEQARDVSASMYFFLQAAIKIGSQKREKILSLCCVLVTANKKSLPLVDCSTEKDLESVINSDFRTFTNSQSLLANSYQP